MNVLQIIDNTVKNNKIVLYMKGEPDSPRCGFSAVVVEILKNLKAPFLAVDVLKDEEIRQSIKIYSNWPTIPQLYVNGEFIGGCDIAKEMYQSGELSKIISQ